jgi:hypothetical protein
LRREGIDPEKDVKIITAGDNPARLAGISRGVIQFSIMPEPFVRKAEKLVSKDLFDIQSLKIRSGGVRFSPENRAVKSNRAVLMMFSRAMMEAIPLH